MVKHWDISSQDLVRQFAGQVIWDSNRTETETKIETLTKIETETKIETVTKHLKLIFAIVSKWIQS